jgi:ribosomal protein L7/L12
MDIWLYLSLAALAVLAFLTINARISRQALRTQTRLAAIERKLQLITNHLGIAEPEPHLPEVIANLVRGNRIAAIKSYRDSTGTDLATAKEAVDEIARNQGLAGR